MGENSAPMEVDDGVKGKEEMKVEESLERKQSVVTFETAAQSKVEAEPDDTKMPDADAEAHNIGPTDKKQRTMSMEIHEALDALHRSDKGKSSLPIRLTHLTHRRTRRYTQRAPPPYRLRRREGRPRLLCIGLRLPTQRQQFRQLSSPNTRPTHPPRTHRQTHLSPPYIHHQRLPLLPPRSQLPPNSPTRPTRTTPFPTSPRALDRVVPLRRGRREPQRRGKGHGGAAEAAVRRACENQAGRAAAV